MAYDLTEKKEKMSNILANNALKELAKNLELTPEQSMKARSRALALSTDSKLQSCDQFSLARFCFETARYNFTRDDCIYPVPYAGKVQTQMGYKGLVELAMRSGKYNEVSCSLVYDCDKVVRNRETGSMTVEFADELSPNAKVIGYQAYAVSKDGQITNKLYMSKAQMEKHGRHYSKSYNSIWGDKEFGFDKMARKTVLKQLCGELDMTPELKMAIAQDQVIHGKENEEDKYEDNPIVAESKEVTRAKTGIGNSIIPETVSSEVEETSVESKADGDGVVAEDTFPFEV